MLVYVCNEGLACLVSCDSLSCNYCSLLSASVVSTCMQFITDFSHCTKLHFYVTGLRFANISLLLLSKYTGICFGNKGFKIGVVTHTDM